MEKGGGLQTYSDGTFFIKSPLRGNCGGLWRNGEPAARKVEGKGVNGGRVAGWGGEFQQKAGMGGGRGGGVACRRDGTGHFVLKLRGGGSGAGGGETGSVRRAKWKGVNG